jgi:hypothetical protein
MNLTTGKSVGKLRLLPEMLSHPRPAYHGAIGKPASQMRMEAETGLARV